MNQFNQYKPQLTSLFDAMDNDIFSNVEKLVKKKLGFSIVSPTSSQLPRLV